MNLRMVSKSTVVLLLLLCLAAGSQLSNKVSNLEDEMLTIKVKQDSYDTGLNEHADELLSLIKNFTAIQEETLAILNGDLVALKETVAAQDDALTSQDDELTSLIETVTAQDEDLTALKATKSTQDGEIATLKEAVAAQNTTIAAQNSKIATLQTTRTTLTNKLAVLESKETRIIKAPTGSLRSAACLVTCVGSTGAGNTTWSSGTTGYVSTNVDMSGCGFTSTPIITATAEGSSYIWDMMLSVNNARSTAFHVYLFGWVYNSYYPTGVSSTKPDKSTADSYRYNVNWQATGYVC